MLRIRPGPSAAWTGRTQKTVPIIAITANAFQEVVQKCPEAGMNAHLAKPLDMEKVRETTCAQVGKQA